MEIVREPIFGQLLAHERDQVGRAGHKPEWVAILFERAVEQVLEHAAHAQDGRVDVAESPVESLGFDRLTARQQTLEYLGLTFDDRQRLLQVMRHGHEELIFRRQDRALLVGGWDWTGRLYTCHDIYERTVRSPITKGMKNRHRSWLPATSGTPTIH